MDGLYVVRQGDENHELRYSIRSLVAHLSHDRVWIAGYKPAEVIGVEYVPVARVGNRYDNARANLMTACMSSVLSDPFVFLNDDFFILEPCETVPVLHRGTIADVLGSGRRSPYAQGLSATGALLESWGYPCPISYEMHTPIVLFKDRVLDIIGRLENEPRIDPLGFRSLYGNVYGLGGEYSEDVKIRNLEEDIPPGASFVSSADVSFRKGRVGAQIRERFPDPSQYEVSR